MRIESVELENFMSFSETCVSFDGSGEDCWLILGIVDGSDESSNNGCGKSSLFEAVVWALTGKTCRGATAGGVVRAGQKRCRVRLGFSFRGKKILVDREWSERIKSLEVSVDGSRIERHTVKETTQQLLELLGFWDWNLLILLFAFGRRFQSFGKMSPTEKAAILEKVAGSEKWENARIAAGEGGRELEIKIKALEREEELLENEVRQLDLRKQSMDKEYLSLLEKLDERRKQDDELFGELELDLESVRKDLRFEEEGLERLRSVRHELEVRWEQGSNELGVAGKWLGDLELRENQYRRLVKEGKCPICGTEGKKHERIHSWNSLLGELETGLEEMREIKQSFEIELAKRREELDKCRRETEEGYGRLKELGRREAIGLGKFAALKAKVDPDKDLSFEIKGRMEEIEKRLESCLESKKRIRQEKEEFRRRFQAIQYWKVGMKAIRFRVMDAVVVAFEKSLDYLVKYLGLEAKGLRVSAYSSAGKPEITLTLDREGGVSLPVEVLSEGETQRIDVAQFIAIRELVKRGCGLSIESSVWDEPLSGLDASGKEAMFQLIQRVKGQKFIIDHDGTFTERFTQKIWIEKNSGCSVVRDKR